MYIQIYVFMNMYVHNVYIIIYMDMHVHDYR